MGPEGLLQDLGQVLPLPEDLTADQLRLLSRDEALAELSDRVHAAYDHREAQLRDVLAQARAELGGYILALTHAASLPWSSSTWPVRR